MLKWDEACDETLNELKWWLLSTEALKYPEFEKKFKVHIYASCFTIRSVLM